MVLIDLYWNQPFTWLSWNGDWQYCSLFSGPKFLLLTPSDSNLCVTQLLLRTRFINNLLLHLYKFFQPPVFCHQVDACLLYRTDISHLMVSWCHLFWSPAASRDLFLFSYLFWHLDGIWGGERGKHRCSGFWPIFWPMYDLSCCSLLHYILLNSEAWRKHHPTELWNIRLSDGNTSF